MAERWIEYTNPRTSEIIRVWCDTTCICHTIGGSAQALKDGCCSQCGCPKTSEGWDLLAQPQRDQRARDALESYLREFPEEPED